MTATPEVHYCRVPSGGHVATASLGDGPPLIILPGWLCHLHEFWTHPSTSSARARLTRTHRLIWYDRLGCGLSDRQRFPHSLRNDADQLLAVMDTLGIACASLIGHCAATPAAATFAAWYPERVDRLICCSGFARGSVVAAPHWFEGLNQLIRIDWPLATRVLAAMLVPSGGSQDIEWFNGFQRTAATPAAAQQLLDHIRTLDACPFLPHVRAPTLVLHDRHDPAIPLDAGKEMAALIPGARLYIAEGRDHGLFMRASGSILETILAFITGRPLNGERSPPASQDQLTQREQEVLRLIAEGMTNKEIARTLGISPGTVERHVTNIYGKMAVRGRAEAAMRAVQLGLTSLREPS
ncbi:MAG: alpha/beta fold hydrolase [Ectothiorhodospiraceae bacterium]|nr:alpha/beta fold hydrolase [Ectothiorhodospiraceae bacterium]